MKKRLLIGLIVGGVVFASAYGIAASLGVLTTSDLGAAGQDVATCDTDGVTVNWDTAYTTTHGFEVTDVTLSNVNSACDGSEVTVLLSGDTPATPPPTGDDNGELGRETETWPAATTNVFDFSADNIQAEDVYGVDVLIDGNAADVTP